MPLRAHQKEVDVTQFDESQLAHAAVVLLGGPMDGQRFKVPMLPPSMMVPESIDLPLKQPASSSPLALYKLTSEEPVACFFVYLFAGCSSPDGEGVLYAPDFEVATSGALDLSSHGLGDA